MEPDPPAPDDQLTVLVKEGAFYRLRPHDPPAAGEYATVTADLLNSVLHGLKGLPE
ncbi:hypothetical protein [Streptomyces sp. NBC_01508]|uniref:hypothetical protein n=1 Tax=Streptomyces sp. NBC_01508 TaxID=2903888 RepID=UPI00386B1BAB